MAGDSGNPNKVYEDLISNEEWHQIVAKKLRSIDFKLEETRIGPLSEDQLGFMGDHLKLEATVQLPNSATKEKLQFFAKSLPMKNETFRKYVDGVGSFHKEINFFSELLSDLQKYIAPDIKVSEISNHSSVKNWTCECYFSKPEILVLEDLFELGFQQIGDRKPMDYDHCVLLLQQLGHIHAASIIFEENQGIKIIDKYKDILYEIDWVMTEGHPACEFLRTSIKGMLSLLEYIPKYGRDSKDFEMISEKFPEALEQICEYVKPSTKFRNVLCHGDLWASNLFFRYDKNSSKPVEVRLIDFQLIRYNPPANEIMWFLYLVTRRKFREEHLDEFLEVYYQSLTAELKRNNLDVNRLLPWSEFKESCDFYRNSGRTAALLCFQQCLMAGDYLKNIFSDPDQLEMFQRHDKSKYLIECYENDPVYREVNTEIIEEFIEFCIPKENRK